MVDIERLDLEPSLTTAASARRARAGAGEIVLVAPGGVEERGGIGRLVANTARYWRESDSGPRFRLVDPYGTGNLFWMPLYFLRGFVQIVFLALSGRAVLLHVHMASKCSALRKALIVLLGKALGLPVILHLHSPTFPLFIARLPRPLRSLLLSSLGRADRILVLGEGWRRIAIATFGFDAERVTTLMNAVQTPEFSHRVRRQGPARILFLGKLIPRKGVDELLEALASKAMAELDWEVVIAGGGAVDRYRDKALALGLGDNVDILDWQPDAEAQKLLADSDIFVLPSHFEGLSIAMLEAMAHGLAVVVTPVGATEEVLTDDLSGLLVPVGDVEALAQALARLVREPAERARLQAAARERFNEKFEISVYCRELEGIYDAVLRERVPLAAG